MKSDELIEPKCKSSGVLENNSASDRSIVYRWMLLDWVGDFQGVFPRFRTSAVSPSNIVPRPDSVQVEVDEWIATSQAATKLTR